MPAPAEIQAATLKKFIDGWAGWTPEGFLATWSDECTQTSLPFNCGVAPRTREHTNKIFPLLMSVVKDFKLSVHNIIHDPSSGKAAIYAVTDATSPFGPYHNEHAVFVWFDESGEKVYRIEEMFDGVFMKDFLPKLEKYMLDEGLVDGPLSV